MPRLRLTFLVPVLLLPVLPPETASAQPRPEQAIQASIGAVSSGALDEEDEQLSGGLYVGGEYILPASRWVGLRPYAALLLTWPDETDPLCESLEVSCEVTTRALATGVKGRLVLPIPYFAPFVEIGVGFTLGFLKTRTPFEERTRLAAVNVPLGLGVALGAEHKYEVSIGGLVHPGANQLSGMLAFGLTFPLEFQED